MANAQKYTRAACGHLAAHYERRKDEKGEYVKFGNQDIDPQKTHLNYNLAPRRGVEQIDFIRQRTTEARTLKRDDVSCNVFARVDKTVYIPPTLLHTSQLDSKI